MVGGGGLPAAHRLAVEYDGRWHGDPARFVPDRRRLNRLTAAGWRVLFVTAEDLRHPLTLVLGVARALGVSHRAVG